MRKAGAAALALAAVLPGCVPASTALSTDPLGGAAACTVDRGQVSLPRAIPEASGLGFSRRDSTLLWTHNDSGGAPVVYGVDRSGQLLGEVRLTGVENTDWEDLEIAECDRGMSCIWIADTGDNLERRSDIALLRFREPDPATLGGGAIEVAPDRFPIALPDGPRDIEAMHILPGEAVFVVTKGRNHPPTVYRYPLPLRSGERVVLEEVARLGDERASLTGRITASSASPDGRWIAVRSYDALSLYRPTDGGRLGRAVFTVPLLRLAEPQGEGVAIGNGGEVVLASEGGGPFRSSSLRFLRCPGVLEEE